MFVVVDRIEGKIAVLELPERGGYIDIPVKFLPSGVKERNILEMNFKINKKAEEKQNPAIKGSKRRRMRTKLSWTMVNFSERSTPG